MRDQQDKKGKCREYALGANPCSTKFAGADANHRKRFYRGKLREAIFFNLRLQASLFKAKFLLGIHRSSVALSEPVLHRRRPENAARSSEGSGPS